MAVDLHAGQVVARRLLEDSSTVRADIAAAAVGWLAAELLPGWYEDWVLLEAENWRQLRLHALEAAAGVLAGAARFGEAVAAAQAAVEADPLRESSHAALIAVHLSEGNQSEAVREFEHYRQQLKTALGLEPSERLRALVAGLSRPSRPGHARRPPLGDDHRARRLADDPGLGGGGLRAAFAGRHSPDGR